MELVYLWIEDYKNIKKQGFNFSPRFDCKFKDKYVEDGKLDENCELVISKNDDYVSIFPDNINITAIVGKNGSGKSSIGGEFYAKITSYLLNGANDYIQTSFLFLVYLKNTYYLISNIKVINCSKENLQNYSSFLELENEDIFYSSCALAEYTGRDYHFSDAFVKSNNSILGLMRGEMNKCIEQELNDILKKINFSYKIATVDTSKINAKVSFQNENDETIKFSMLSFGEKYIINVLNQIFNRLSNNKPCLIFLDEITVSLHPEWQRVFIHDIFDLFKDYKVHFIITSHSPFLLSDLPKENIIFLKDGKQEMAFEHKQTFGANIHTLLSDGFFMDGGLMGEFAKNKITEIMNYLSNDEKLITIKENQVKNIIESIGENFLKEKLLSMYNKKFSLKSKDEEITELKEEIERLKNAQNSI